MNWVSVPSDNAEGQGAESPLFIASLAKGLGVLRSFGGKHRDMSLKEIAEMNELSMGSAQRIAHTLETLGLLTKDPKTKRYRLGVGSLAYGSQYLETDPLFERANTTLLELSQQCEETVNLHVPSGNDVVLVARVQSRKHIPIYLPVGRRIPLFCTASGRACLSTVTSNELIKTRIASLPKQRYTNSTIVDNEQLFQRVMQAREEGYSYSAGEYFIGDLNVAAAVTDETGLAVAAVNISVPAERWTPERIREELAPLVMRASRALSASARG